jgi:hypothetical protein
MFNTILQEAGLLPPTVRLIRHKDKRAKKGRTPYDLWRDNRPLFELYQSTQAIAHRSKLNAPYWAVFIATPSNETMFAGIYAVDYLGLLAEDRPMPQMDGVDKAGSCDDYALTIQDNLSHLIGKVIIDWGSGARAWIQYAERQNKPIAKQVDLTIL